MAQNWVRLTNPVLVVPAGLTDTVYLVGMLLKFDNALWNDIVADLSLEEYAALTATCRWDKQASRLPIPVPCPGSTSCFASGQWLKLLLLA